MKKTFLILPLLILILIIFSSCGGGSGTGIVEINTPIPDQSSTATPVGYQTPDGTQPTNTPDPFSTPTPTTPGDDPSSGGISVDNEYLVLAWNDLGMHCLNPTYDSAVILPPYNNVFAQVIKRGEKPEVITSGVTVEYKIINNTYSYGKRRYGQFWDIADTSIFGIDLALNTGLNLEDPGIHNGLSGTMVVKDNHFQVDGIPITPVDDSNIWNPYQVMQVSVKNTLGQVIAETKTTVPTSDEINCAKCHSTREPELTNNPEQDPTVVFNNVLDLHDEENGTNLLNNKPVLCASCHGSPALGTNGPGDEGYLSKVIHSKHADENPQADCYSCHPGEITECSRSIAHTNSDGNCTTCHGDLKQMGDSIKNGRIPWVEEPKCSTCHQNVAEVDTGTDLYRFGKGHGDLYCASCHGSPHAQLPTNIPSEFLFNGTNQDHIQALQYQSSANSLGSCSACHPDSKGNGIGDFVEVHGGPNPEEVTACNVCHTSVTGVISMWPHSFEWKNR